MAPLWRSDPIPYCTKVKPKYPRQSTGVLLMTSFGVSGKISGGDETGVFGQRPRERTCQVNNEKWVTFLCCRNRIEVPLSFSAACHQRVVVRALPGGKYPALHPAGPSLWVALLVRGNSPILWLVSAGGEKLVFPLVRPQSKHLWEKFSICINPVC